MCLNNICPCCVVYGPGQKPVTPMGEKVDYSFLFDKPPRKLTQEELENGSIDEQHNNKL